MARLKKSAREKTSARATRASTRMATISSRTTNPSLVVARKSSPRKTRTLNVVVATNLYQEDVQPPIRKTRQNVI